MPSDPKFNAPELLTTAEVAALLGVDPKTVARWAKNGKLRCIKTLGGHRRYFAEDFAKIREIGTLTQEPW
jgi:excisionase family DNA binding protein